MTNILVVDDEKKICEFVKAYLDKEGYDTDIVYDGKTAIDYFDKNKYDIIVLDRMLPDISGEEVCRYIRKKSDTPIVMLTAKIEDEDRIEGFNLGCDDYLCKPFNVKELVLRVKAILKKSFPIVMLTAKIEDEDRIEGFNLGCDDYLCKPFNVKELVLRVKAILKKSFKSSEKSMLKFEDELEIDTESHDVKVRGEYIILTNTEYKLLLMMASNPNKVYTRIELLEAINEGYYERLDRAIDNHIKNLRQKIELDSRNGRIIQTVYGVGYKFGLKE